MTVVSRKTHIARAFNRAAPAYHTAAGLQRVVAQGLAERIGTLKLKTTALPSRILEIGCGTGQLTEHVRPLLPEAAWTLTDIAWDMLKCCQKRLSRSGDVSFVCMDGERPAVTGGFDLICSSLTWQWFDDPASAVITLAELLCPGGVLAFSTLATEGLVEWRHAHEDLGLGDTMSDYITAAKLSRTWPKTGSGHVEEEWIARTYPNALAFVSELKRIGAHTPPPLRRPLPPGQFRRLLDRLGGNAEIAITYRVAYGIFTRTAA